MGYAPIGVYPLPLPVGVSSVENEMPAALSKPVLTERFGALNLPIGGTHGYVGVRKVRKGRFQGYTPKKKHTTADFETAHKATVARALLQQDICSGARDTAEKKPRTKRRLSAGACLRDCDRERRRLSHICCGVRVRCVCGRSED